MISKKDFCAFFKGAPKPAEDYYLYAKAFRESFPIVFESLFLATVYHESAGLKRTVESHNYSWERLMEVFPKYFKTEALAKCYQKSESIFDKVYANRMGNGGVMSGDGSHYKGRGYIMLTGKNNYRRFGLDKDPEKLEKDKYAMWVVALQFWRNDVEMKMFGKGGPIYRILRGATRRVNGGYIGMDHRWSEVQRLMKLLHTPDKPKEV